MSHPASPERTKPVLLARAEEHPYVKKDAIVSGYGSLDSPWIRPDHLRLNREVMRDVLLGLFMTAGFSLISTAEAYS